jgi:hypothetical protein
VQERRLNNTLFIFLIVGNLIIAIIKMTKEVLLAVKLMMPTKKYLKEN